MKIPTSKFLSLVCFIFVAACGGRGGGLLDSGAITGRSLTSGQELVDVSGDA